MSRDEMAAALLDVAEGRLPRDRLALKCLYEDMQVCDWHRRYLVGLRLHCITCWRLQCSPKQGSWPWCQLWLPTLCLSAA